MARCAQPDRVRTRDGCVERWLDRMGPEAAAAWVEFNNEEPALTIRANTLKTSRELLGERLLDAGVGDRAPQVCS